MKRKGYWLGAMTERWREGRREGERAVIRDKKKRGKRVKITIIDAVTRMTNNTKEGR